MWSCYEALDFGRMPIELTVLRLGWNPKATAPTFLERLFKRTPEQPARLRARPLPQTLPQGIPEPVSESIPGPASD